VSEADLALLLTALCCLALRVAGVLVAGALRPDHPFVAWASAVSQATLAAFVARAVAAPSGALAGVPLAARVGALAAALLAYTAFGRRLLPAMLAGLAVALLVRGGG
jgi:hypothetical protein